MSNSCNFMICSSFDNNLSPLLNIVTKNLSKNGHNSFLFEKNFGFKGNYYFKRWINKAEEADLIIPFISHKNNTFINNIHVTTATYIAHRTAITINKPIITFVKKDIIELFSNIEPIIKAESIRYMYKYGSKPPQTHFIMSDVNMHILKYQPYIFEEYKKTDDFTWSFIYDINCMGRPLYSFDLSYPFEVTEKINELLSEFTKIGMMNYSL